MILIIDNYDSFTYNVYQVVSTLTNHEVRVYRNDEITIEMIRQLPVQAIILSPGPAHPKNSNVCLDVISTIDDIPILGICLGHQAIGLSYGAEIGQLERPFHGKRDMIYRVEDSSFLEGLPSQFEVMRYHSLYVVEETLPPFFIVDAKSADGVIQAMHHREKPLYSVQFHPESYFTAYGDVILNKFLTIANAKGEV